MADLVEARQRPEDMLWKELANVTAVMVSVDAPDELPQPMAPILESDAYRIWFFTKASTDLVRAVGLGARGRVVVIGRDHDLHASLGGSLVQSTDGAMIDKLWTPGVAAWYSGGRADPEIALLRFDPLQGLLWASTSNSLLFGWEMVRANLSSAEPEVGIKSHLRF